MSKKRKPTAPITKWTVGNELPFGFSGVPVGSKDNNIYFSNEQIHALIVGTTGSGKTQKIIFPMIYGCGHSGESMIITDPKGEIHRETSGYLAKKGYDIVVLNLRDTFHSDSWNVIDTALKYYEESVKAFEEMEKCTDEIEKNRLLNLGMRCQQDAFEYVNEVAYSITHQSESKDPFWDNAAQGVLTSVLFSLVKGTFNSANDNEINQHRRNLYSAVSILNSYAHTEPEQSKIHEYMQTLPTGDSALNAYSVISRSGSQTGGSIYTTLSTATQIFTDQGIAQITCKSERTDPVTHEKKPFNLKDIGARKTAVYVIFPDEKASRGLIPSLFVDACYKELVEYANSNGGSTKVRVNMILDEFAQFPKIADLEKKLAVARSRGIRFSMIIQGFNQLDKVYGKEVAGIIRENCNLTIYLLSGDFETAERISKMIGKQTIKKSSISMGSDDKSSVNMSTDLIQRDLMMPEEILRLGKDVCLVLLTGMNPIKAPVDYYYRMQCLQNLKEEMHPLPILPSTDIDPFSRTLPVFDFIKLKDESVAIKASIDKLRLIFENSEKSELKSELEKVSSEINFVFSANAKNALQPELISFIYEQGIFKQEIAVDFETEKKTIVEKNNQELKTKILELLKAHPFFSRFKTITLQSNTFDINPLSENNFDFESDKSVAEVAKIFIAAETKHGEPKSDKTISILNNVTKKSNSLEALEELLSVTVQFPKKQNKNKEPNKFIEVRTKKVKQTHEHNQKSTEFSTQKEQIQNTIKEAISRKKTAPELVEDRQFKENMDNI
ncbi:MAG: VirD4-like conjugal transfer protein, CD1115 family [Culicoidibacterales bacterium]